VNKNFERHPLGMASLFEIHGCEKRVDVPLLCGRCHFADNFSGAAESLLALSEVLRYVVWETSFRA